MVHFVSCEVRLQKGLHVFAVSSYSISTAHISVLYANLVQILYIGEWGLISFPGFQVWYFCTYIHNIYGNPVAKSIIRIEIL